MAIIQSGASADLWTIDPASNAGRVTEYRPDGTAFWTVPTGVYSFAMADVVGVAAANQFVSLFNPAGSGKMLRVFRVRFNGYAVAVTVAKNSMHVTRITTATAGSLQAASAINKFQSTFANPVAEVRTTNPTVTAAAEWLNFAPAVTITAAGAVTSTHYEWSADYPDEEIVLDVNEGVVFRQTVAGDTDQTYNFEISWKEI